jgi:thioredoxin 1
MKLHLLPLACLALALPSCDRAKALVDKAKAAGATAPATPNPTGKADVRPLAASDFDTFIATPERLVVVDFHADWCGPCKVLGPVLEQVAGEFPGRVSIGKINVDQARELAGREQVSSIPDVRLYRDGKQVAKFVGSMDAGRVRSLFEKHSEGLAAAPAPAQAADPAQPAPAAPPIQPIQPMTKDWRPPGIERR